MAKHTTDPFSNTWVYSMVKYLSKSRRKPTTKVAPNSGYSTNIVRIVPLKQILSKVRTN